MMNNTMNYLGYIARVEFDPRDEIFVGRLLGIADHQFSRRHGYRTDGRFSSRRRSLSGRLQGIGPSS